MKNSSRFMAAALLILCAMPSLVYADEGAATRTHVLEHFDDAKSEHISAEAVKHGGDWNIQRQNMGKTALTAKEQALCTAEKCGKSFKTLMHCIGTHKKVKACVNAGQKSYEGAYNILRNAHEENETNPSTALSAKQLGALKTKITKQKKPKGQTKQKKSAEEKRVINSTHYVTALNQLDEIKRAAYFLYIIAIADDHHFVYGKANKAIDGVATFIDLDEEGRAATKGAFRKAAKSLGKEAQEEFDEFKEQGQDHATAHALSVIEGIINELEEMAKGVQNKRLKKIAQKVVKHLKCNSLFCGHFFGITFECMVESEKSGKPSHRSCANAAYKKFKKYLPELKDHNAPKNPGALIKKYNEELKTDAEKDAFLKALTWAAKQTGQPFFDHKGEETSKLGTVKKTQIAKWAKAMGSKADIAKEAEEEEEEAEEEEKAGAAEKE